MQWIAWRPQGADGAAAGPPIALGWSLLRFTPRVASHEEAWLLEVSASLRLFGGLRPLVQHLKTAVSEQNEPQVSAEWGYGATALIALARARCPAPKPPVERLPLHTLSAARPHLAVLESIGCRCWGDLRGLPRDGVARRFGQPLLDALDQAYGERPESHQWLELPAVFDERLELDQLVDDAPSLLFGARRLLGRLRGWLAAQNAGVTAVRLGWVFDVRRSLAEPGGELVLRLAEPAQDMPHLTRLMAEHLAHVTLPAPVFRLTLRSLAVTALPGASKSLLLEPGSQGDSLAELVERLSARLGPQQVRRWQGRAHHLPERQQAWLPAQPLLGLPVKPPGPDRLRPEALRPAWLLDEPLPLVCHGRRPQYHGPLRLLAGPQRIEASLWAGEAAGPLPSARDYFVARSDRAGLLWVFRSRLEQPVRWHLHGFFG